MRISIRRSIALSMASLTLLLSACGAAQTPTTAATTVSAVAEAASTIVPTNTMLPTATIVPTGTSAPTATTTIMPTQTTAPTIVPSPTPAPTTKPTAAPQLLAQAATKTVTIKLFQFKPATLEVKAGTTVVWTNQDAIQHSVTSGTPPNPSGAFDSQFFDQGKSFAFTFTQPGTYTYFCMRHNSMTGTLTVVP